MASHQGSSRRPDPRTMSRRKQAKPQHINSEEGQGEQPLQQPSPDLAEAPAAEEPGESVRPSVRASREDAPSTAVRPSSARVWEQILELGFWTRFRERRGESGTEGGILTPPQVSPGSLILIGKLAPLCPASLSLQLASPCPQSDNWFPSPRYTSTPTPAT